MKKYKPDPARVRRAKEIAKEPEYYKICLCCESVVNVDTDLCEFCHSYRFTSKGVGQQAMKIATSEPRGWTGPARMN